MNDTLPEPDGTMYVARYGGLDPIGEGYIAATVRELIAQAVAEAVAECSEVAEHLHCRNAALMLAVSDMTAAMVRMAAGIEHLAEIARQWEPDHSSRADRRGWLLAQDAKNDAEKLLAELPARIRRPSASPSLP